MFKLLAILALTLVGSALAVACGDDDNYGNSSTPTTSASVASNSAASATTAAASPSSAAASTSTVTSGEATSVKIATTAKGQVLTDASGFTLYTYDKDTPGDSKSACSGGCATAWPAATVTGTPAKPAGLTGELTTITRDDGSKQLSYAGHPLYRYAADKAAGDTSGDGVGGVWHVAKATATGASTTSSSSDGSGYAGY